MLRNVVRRLAVSSLALLLGCASGSSGRTGPRVDPQLITRDELQSREYTNMYDAIQALRANWMRTRGTDSFQSPTSVLVYLDNQRLGGLEQLRSLTPRTIASARWYSGIEATSRWGLDHGSGVIYLTSAR